MEAADACRRHRNGGRGSGGRRGHQCRNYTSADRRRGSFGVPMTNAVSLMPTTIAGQKINYTLLDSRTDVTQTASNTRKLVTENKVDVLIGEAVTPTSLAMAPIAGENKTPMLATTAIKDAGLSRRRHQALGLQDRAERRHDGAAGREVFRRSRRQDARGSSASTTPTCRPGSACSTSCCRRRGSRWWRWSRSSDRRPPPRRRP